VERTQFATFDRVIVSSPSDLHHPSTSLVRSPHVMPDRVPQRPAEPDLDIVFVGRMSYRANVEAIEFFARNVLPLIHRSRPDVRLHVVGADPTRQVRRLANDGIVVHGRVESVVDFYRRARVSIVPVQAATGVQMKLIESLYMGVPTVCTPVTASQAGIEPGTHCLTATDPRQWSSAVLDLLSAGPEAGQMARAGAAWASSAYRRDTIESDLLGVVRGIEGVS
ncbi:MAG: glycosyltransferase family 4 protein, partial [Ornithinimicrobium sp.]